MASSLSSKISALAHWTLKIVVGLAFVAAAIAKLVGAPMMVQEFGVLGLGQWLRYFTAAVELTSVVLLLIPRSSRLGGLGLLCVCVGALVAQAGVLHGDLAHVFVLMAASAVLAWTGLGWPRVTSALSVKPVG